MDTQETLKRFHSELALVDIVARNLGREVSALLNHDEMLSFGREGLLEAARRYDPERGVAFRSYAAYRVRGAILDGVRTHALPRRAYEKVRALTSALSVSEGLQEDTAAAVAGGLRGEAADQKVTEHLAALATAMAVGMASAQAVGEEGERIAVHEENPEQRAESAELIRIAQDEIGRMPEKEATLIRRHIMGDEPLETVSRDLGLSKSWASRILARGMNTLTKRMMNSCR